MICLQGTSFAFLGAVLSAGFLVKQRGGSPEDIMAMIFGVWSELLIGQWSGIDILVDQYTGSNAGTVRVVAFHDCDFAVRHPESFVECNEIVTT